MNTEDETGFKEGCRCDTQDPPVDEQMSVPERLRQMDPSDFCSD
jgi:hypothetical protein